jgi:4-hydroxy-tetrahydrodipicolinate reductase
MEKIETSTHVWIHGILGKVGQVLESAVRKSDGLKLQGGSDLNTTATELEQALLKSNLVIDFTSAEGNSALYKAFSKQKDHLQNIAVLICSTGLTDEQKEFWEKLGKNSRLRVLFAPNTSIGILMLLKSALLIASLSQESGFDIEIEECHHREKKDSPSGTALFLAESLQASLPKSRIIEGRKGPRHKHEIGITCTRGGGVFGEHKIKFLGDFEELTLIHRAFSRELYAKGTIALAKWLWKQPAGVYSLKDVVIESLS